MNRNKEIYFWVAVIALLTIFFKSSFEQWRVSFYFVTFLFPVVFATSKCFESFLVPRYLLQGKTIQFGIYLLYLLIFSIYLELWVIITALVILANYQIQNLGAIASNAYLLTVVMYAIVLAYGFIGLFLKLKEKNSELNRLAQEKMKDAQSTITIKVNRKNIPITISEILVIESLSDYVKIHTTTQQYICKQKISALNTELPTYFLRIHRSFVINQNHIQSYSRESVTINGNAYPISRTYKKECLEVLEEGFKTN